VDWNGPRLAAPGGDFAPVRTRGIDASAESLVSCMPDSAEPQGTAATPAKRTRAHSILNVWTHSCYACYHIMMQLPHRTQVAVRANAGLYCAIVLVVVLAAIAGVSANSEPSARSFTSPKNQLARQAYRAAALHLGSRETGNGPLLNIAPFEPERATLLSDGRYAVSLPYLVSGSEETLRVRIAHAIVNCTVKTCDVSGDVGWPPWVRQPVKILIPVR
jgi:hypothetical protein